MLRRLALGIVVVLIIVASLHAVTGAYEAAVRAQAAAAGVPSSDPKVLAAIEQARKADAKAAKLAEQRAAEDRARDAEVLAAIAALARPCPVVDAGVDGGR